MGTELATRAANTPVNIIDGYSSIVGDDFETRKRVLTAVTNAEQLSEHVGETILIKDILVQPVQSENEKTGEVEDYLRTTLIAEDGTAYAAGSSGLAMSVRNILGIMGEPSTWPEPLAAKVVEKPSSKGKGWKFFTLELV